MDFHRVNLHDDEAFMAWSDVLDRSEIQREQGHGGWLPQEWRARALNETVPSYFQLFTYGDIQHPVAIGSLEVTRDDNLSWIGATLDVDPEQRRRGYGSTMLHHLEAAARELGRSSLLFWQREGANEIGEGPSRAFASRHGYDVVQENVQRDITWPRPAGELDQRFVEWSPHAGAYDVQSWIGAAPEEVVEGRAYLSAVMPVEAPSGDFAPEEERWDEARVRQHERRVEEMRRDLLVAVAIHRENATLVGYSELTVSREWPDTAYQWDTLVLGAHRGHRLGGLLKIATMRLLERGGYDTTRTTTFNARQRADDRRQRSTWCARHGRHGGVAKGAVLVG
jgi:GNAT superfamily N-acetyltransferase